MGNRNRNLFPPPLTDDVRAPTSRVNNAWSNASTPPEAAPAPALGGASESGGLTRRSAARAGRGSAGPSRPASAAGVGHAFAAADPFAGQVSTGARAGGEAAATNTTSAPLRKKTHTSSVQGAKGRQAGFEWRGVSGVGVEHGARVTRAMAGDGPTRSGVVLGKGFPVIEQPTKG